MKTKFAALFLTFVAANPAFAQLRITEAMSSAGVGPDWFELTNFGAAAVDITGYKVEDSSNDFALSQNLLGVTSIAAGESVVFAETDDPAGVLPVFRNLWTANGLAGVQVGSYSGSGLGLSSGGDGLNLFAADGTNLNLGVSFGAATAGVSFGYDTTTNTFGGLSVAGQFGAFVSADPIANVGSPGTVGGIIPEPASITLAGMALLASLRRKR
jgi:hypothetical protein